MASALNSSSVGIYTNIKEKLRVLFRGGPSTKFTIEARQASKENKYIQSAKLNGKPIADFRILQREVLKGGILELGNQPNKEWGVQPNAYRSQ
jgi:putative alpha-1,2-mannosidase